MRIARRLFLVPLADNDHGKTLMIRGLVSQGVGYAYTPPQPQKGARTLISPWGREVDAYIFGRSYQETEKGAHETVEEALVLRIKQMIHRLRLDTATCLGLTRID